MLRALEELIKVLSLEQRIGYPNKAVIGGLDKFAPYWKEEALAETTNASARAEIERIANGLAVYPTCETPEQRATIVSGLLEQLRQLDSAPASDMVPASLEVEPQPSQPDDTPSLPPLEKPRSPDGSAGEPEKEVETEVEREVEHEQSTTTPTPVPPLEKPGNSAGLPAGTPHKEVKKEAKQEQSSSTATPPPLEKPQNSSELTREMKQEPPASPTQSTPPLEKPGEPEKEMEQEPATPPLEKPRNAIDTPTSADDGEESESSHPQPPPLAKPQAPGKPANDSKEAIDSDVVTTETATVPPIEKPSSRPPAPVITAWDADADVSAPPAEPRQPAGKSPERVHQEPPPHEGQGLEAEISVLPSVGVVQSKRLVKLGVRTVGNLLQLFPRRYDDYSQLKTIRELMPGEDVTLMVNIRNTTLRKLGGKRSLLKCVVSDRTGSLEITWFNQPYLQKQLQVGRQIVVSGRIEQYLGRPTMNAPEWEPLDKEQIHTGRLVAVYPLTEGVTSRWLRRLIKQTLEHWADRVPDHLPQASRQRHSLIDLSKALREIHFPANEKSLAEARRRLIFDEFLLLQLGVLRQRQVWREQEGRALAIGKTALDKFITALPYSLTGAQERALDDILRDILAATPMNRLLQGDVGSGKTVVAAAAAVGAIRAGYQAALMAPTEILAEQHYKNVGALLEHVTAAGSVGERPVVVRLLTGSNSAAEKQTIYQELENGTVDIVIGTHALIQEGVQFNRLALVIIDEQHRFGVAQRGALRQKGYNPHILVMTATPIPRTLSLTLFGDLDVSVIDELPPGRQPIKTYIVTERERERAYRFVHSQIEAGHQAFIICPLVEESEKIDARAAVDEHKRLQTEIFPQLRLGLLHGRLKSEEKDAVMRQFGAGELDVLVSTSVVEVGIDVPNATVMLIEGADRFGLSQLHQFRGRVGRGDATSYCLLVSEHAAGDAWDRLKAIAESQDGFALAEKDLQMRGPGEFFGTRQSGLPDLRLAQLADVRMLEKAREEAARLLEEDPGLSRPEHENLREQVDAIWSRVRGEPS